MRLYIKIGTFPAHHYRVKGKRKPPQVGETLSIMLMREWMKGRHIRPFLWKRVKVDTISTLPDGTVLYFVSRES